MVEMRQIEALGRQIAARFRPERIILFGSYANGQPTADSDVDLLVILPFEGYPFRVAAAILKATNPDFAVDLLARTPEQIEQRLAIGDDFIQDILERGKILHKATDAGMGE
ncbi:nucleotidyltransferase domain-containing protein [Sphaerothrix gracilis]|uniref:nucleotidyltransferase domain-containing protein n=1 Tax=Sphaerothrix gracilis TaxID=3151835 RepID=UPI0031FC5AEC